MEINEILREHIFEIIKNQRKDNQQETNETLFRLKQQGFNDFEAKELIGQCVEVELFDMLKHRKPFDKERYIKNLLALPKEPVD